MKIAELMLGVRKEVIKLLPKNHPLRIRFEVTEELLTGTSASSPKRSNKKKEEK